MAASAQDAHPWPIYNARFRVVFPILDADGDLVTGAAALDSELSQDQGTFADATNEATEIATSSGIYYLDLIATELDTKSTAIIVKTTTTGAKTTPLVLYPKRLPVVRTGTAQAGGISTITLDSGASALDKYYNGCYVNITNNSPVNALGQARRITDYVGSTKVATVESAWGTNPDVTSTFEVLAPGDTVNLINWAGTAVSDPTAAGLPEVDVLRFGGTAGTFAAGRPETNTSHVGGSLVNALIAGRMDSNAQVVGDKTGYGIGVGGIAATAFAAGAIDAAAIAANAIGAAEIATDAVNEIRDAISNLAMVEPTAVPAVTATLNATLSWILALSRNKVTQTSTTQLLRNDTDLATIGTSTHSDDGTTHIRGEFV